MTSAIPGFSGDHRVGKSVGATSANTVAMSEALEMVQAGSIETQQAMIAIHMKQAEDDRVILKGVNDQLNTQQAILEDILSRANQTLGEAPQPPKSIN